MTANTCQHLMLNQNAAGDMLECNDCGELLPDEGDDYGCETCGHEAHFSGPCACGCDD